MISRHRVMAKALSGCRRGALLQVGWPQEALRVGWAVGEGVAPFFSCGPSKAREVMLTHSVTCRL